MFIVNRGKANTTFKGIVLGMLWPGKTFGAAQLLGITRLYHCTPCAKNTCHILELSRKSLTAIVQGGAERQWLVGWQQRAKAALESDLKLIKRKTREHRRMLRIGLNLFGESNKEFLTTVFAAWRRVVKSGAEDPASPRSTSRSKTPNIFQLEPRPLDITAKDYMQTAAPIKFNRGLQKVELEVNAAGVTSTNAWRHWTQSGRLDRWKGTNTPTWLSAVREEIPKQLMALKAEARGESSRLPGIR